MDDLRSELKTAAALAAVALAAMVAVATTACGGASAGSAAAFEHVFFTKEAAAQAVADALAARDGDRLLALAVSEREFRTAVWPVLPASRPEVGMPVDYLWAETSAKSRGYLARLMREFGGQVLTVEAVSFGSATTDYGPFRTHAKTQLAARDTNGNTRLVRLFGSMLESQGGWKIFSYIVD